MKKLDFKNQKMELQNSEYHRTLQKMRIAKRSNSILIASIIFFLLFVQPTIEAQPEQCTPHYNAACAQCGNYIANGSFEEYTGDPLEPYIEIGPCDGLVHNVCSWNTIGGSADIFPTGVQEASFYNCSSLGSYEGLSCMRIWGTEAAATHLTEPLIAGESYFFSMEHSGCASVLSGQFSFKIFVAVDELTIVYPMNVIPYTFDPLTNHLLYNGNFATLSNWHNLSFDFICPPLFDGANILGIMATDGQVIFDDLKLYPSSYTPPTIQLPEPLLLCDGLQLPNLQDYITLSTPGSAYTITGPGVVPMGGGVYNFDATLLSAQQLHDGATVTLNNSSSVFGCEVPVSDIIESCCQLTVDAIVGTGCGQGVDAGQIEAVITNVDGEYSLTWQGPNAFSSNNNYIASLIPGNYTVTVSQLNDPLCTVTSSYFIADNGYNPFPPPTYDINVNTTWGTNVTYYMQEDLIVQPGVSLTIDDCTLRFDYGTGIILLEGADLLVNHNSLLTNMENCDNGFWNGIYAEHTSNYTSSVDKTYLKIFGGSTISFADIAIEIKTLYSTTPNQINYWEQCWVSNSHLINNRQDIVANGQTFNASSAPVWVNCSFTDFRLTQDFPPLFLPAYNRTLFEECNKIYFTNCSFINEVPAFLSGAAELIAIKLLYSRIEFYGSVDEADGYSKGRISGFTRGIYAWGNMSTTNANRISGADFFCWREVYLGIMGLSSVWNNGFHMLPPNILNAIVGGLTLNNTLQTIQLESFDIAMAPYGLYLDGTNNYLITDNVFDNAIPGMGILFSHGMIANNNGLSSNKIRRNDFTGIFRGIKLQGNNRNSLKTQGAQYLCNDFINNYTDIRETNTSWGIALSGVRNQGPKDFKNTFTNSNCFDAIKDDISNTASNFRIVSTHQYRRPLLGAGSTEPMTCEATTNSVIILEPFGAENCALNFGIPTSMGGNGNCSVEKATAETAYTNIKILYDAILDGGNTETLVNEVLYADFSEALQTYYSLMGQSPNLSDEVMVQALKNFQLPNVLVAQILASNPQAANSDDVLQEMENRLVPFSQYQHDQIMQGLNSLSNLEVLQQEMASHEADREAAMMCMKIEIDEDENILDKATVIEALLQPNVYYNDLLNKINMRTEQGDYASALLLAAEAHYHFSLSRQDELDLDALQLVLQTEQELQAQQGLPMYNGQRETLEQVMYNNSSFAASRALMLLRAYDNYQYYEPIMDDENETRRANARTNIIEDAALRAYPNPTGNLITIDYKPAGVSLLEVYDVLGKKLMDQKTNVAASQFFLDLDILPPSLYEIRLIDATGLTIDAVAIMKQ